MKCVQYMILYMAKNMGLILMDPIFFILAITVFYLYKREIEKIQKQVDKREYYKHILKNIAVGMTIGLLISGILSYYQMQFYFSNEVLYLIPIAIVLMCIRPQFGCFSYVLSVAYLIQGVLQLLKLPTYHLQYGELILLVGALHLIEGILVIMQGDKLSLETPLYKEGKLIKGYAMRQMWMVPLLFVASSQIVPLYTVLAYGDVATKPKCQKYLTGLLILVYGVMIGGMGIGAIQGKIPLGASVILMPVLHEFIFILSHPPKMRRN